MTDEAKQGGQEPQQPQEPPKAKPVKKHGGARPGAGRKRHEARNARAVMEAERTIQEAFPDILDKLIEEAKKGNWKVGIYLVDRLMGKPTERVEQKEAKDEQKTAMEAALDELAAEGWEV